MRSAKFELFRDTKGEIRFRLKAPNGKIIAVGESYKKKRSARKTIRAIAKYVQDIQIVDLTK